MPDDARPEDAQFELTADQQALVTHLVQTGRFNGTQQVVDAGLRLLDEQERRRAALHEAIREGEESGFAEPFDAEEFLKEIHEEFGVSG